MPRSTDERKRAFESEALAHIDRVYQVALRLTRDETRAEDLVQETYLRACRSWRQYEPGTNARAWLLTILRNTFVSEGRRPHRRARTVELTEVQETLELAGLRQLDPEGESMRQIFGERVGRAITALPVEFRETLVLSDLAGLRYVEVAEVVGVPIGTVKSRLFRARRALQEQLHDYAVDMGYIEPRRARGRLVSGAQGTKRVTNPRAATDSGKCATCCR